jgi:hypothetical protein
MLGMLLGLLDYFKSSPYSEMMIFYQWLFVWMF